MGYNPLEMSLIPLPKITPILGIDLGTSRTRIWLQGKGLVIDEPTVIATDTSSKKVLAVGQDAAEMEGRVQSQIKVYHPVTKGKIHGAGAVKAMLQIWLQQVLGLRYLLSPVVMVSVPAGSTQASRQAVTELIYELGAREVYTIVQPLAAAIGAGVPIADTSGTFIFHLGAGVVEAGVISLGSLVQFKSSHAAGDLLDMSLQKKLASKYQLKLGNQSVLKLKHELLLIDPKDQVVAVVGQDAVGRAPKEVQVESSQVIGATAKIIEGYSDLARSLLAEILPELTVDILDKGVLLSGGLAQLSGLDRWLRQELEIPVAVVENPDLVVIEGIETALENLAEFKQSFGYQETP